VISRRALGLFGLLAAVTGLAAACTATGQGTGASTSAPEGATSRVPVPDDLARLVLRPEGFVPVPGDTFSGAVSRADVPVLFNERPGDAAAIIDHGFVTGTMHSWKSAPPAGDPGTTIPPTAVLLGIVLRFGDHAGAAAVAAYLRDHPQPQDRAMTVPAALPDGHGVTSGPDDVGITSYTVVWTEGVDMVQLTMQYMGTTGDPKQVLDLAVAQHRARNGGLAQ
jgi:hypothetical protein